MSDKEVKVHVKFDSNADSVADKMKKAMGESEHAVHKHTAAVEAHGQAMHEAHGHAHGFLGTIAAMTTGAGLAMVGMHLFHEVVEETTEAFTAGVKEIKRMTSQFQLLDQSGMPLEHIKEYATELHEELEHVAVQSGETTGTLVDVFSDVMARGNRSAEAAKELTAQMALAGRAVPGGPQELAFAFQNIEAGVIRARNPLVGMIAATGILHGNAKQVANEMSKMTVEEQLKIAEEAVAKMSGRMAKMPLSIGQMKNSIKSLMEMGFEEFGLPIGKAMVNELGKVHAFIAGHAEDIAEMAKKAGEFIAEAFEVVQDIWSAVGHEIFESAKDFGNYISMSTHELREVFEYIYENRHVIAESFGDAAKLLMDSAKGWASIIDGTIAMLSAAFEKIFDGIDTVADTINTVTGFGHSGAHQAYMGHKQEHILDQMRQASMTPGGATGMSDLEHEFMANAKSMGMTIDEAGEQIRDAYDLHDQYVRHASEASIASDNMNAQGFAEQYRWAADKHSEAAQHAIAQNLESHKDMAKAIGAAGPEIFGEAAESFIETLKGISPEAAEEIKKAWHHGPKIETGKGGNQIVDMRGSTFQIKQDFRDQNPDRIAVIFRNDLVNAASNKVMARGTSPLGA